MDKERTSIISAIALNSIFGNEPKVIHGIIEAFGSAEAVFALSYPERAKLFGPHSKILSRINDCRLEKAEKEYDTLLSQGYSFVTYFDPAYPRLLKECPDAPMLLYVRSTDEVEKLFNRPFISIVGTRDYSSYGKEWCERIVKCLSTAENPPAIISGLAIGVDICAHLAALGYGLPTIAVSPTGIDGVYPRQHSIAAEKICSRPGCALVTDFPPGTPAMPFTFLRRNRIIAGLSSATIIIESKLRGGAAMTARLAAGYGRNVFALPGRIDDLRSGACNALIAEQIAEPIVNLGTLAEKLGLGKSHEAKAPAVDEMLERRLPGLDRDSFQLACSVLRSIKQRRGISIEELCSCHAESYASMAGLIGRLEACGIIHTDLLQNCYINVKIA